MKLTTTSKSLASELDEEFDLVDGEVPSAVTGSKVSDPDPDAIIDSLNRAFRNSWDDDE